MTSTTSGSPYRIHRKTGTAQFHMSSGAVTVSMEQIYSMSERECLEYLVKNRFGDWNRVVCPHCGTIGKHYFHYPSTRWKCLHCRSSFSVTSGTLFHGHKLRLRQILAAMLSWVNHVGGSIALVLKRELKVSYQTALVLSKKLMEACERGYNVGLLSGDIEIDAVHASGRRADEKRGRPQGGRKNEDDEAPDPKTLTGSGKGKKRYKDSKKPRGVRDPEFGNRYPEARRLVIPVRARSGAYCRGARKTRVAVGLSETPSVVESVLARFVAIPESILNSDGSVAYSAIGAEILEHNIVDHGVQFSGPNGENNNQAEEWNWRMKRSERGMHTHLEPKYLLEYACAAAFRADHCKQPNGETMLSLLSLCMRVGVSRFIGYTRGIHPTVEMIIPYPKYAGRHGPKKGRRSQSNANGPPPR